MVEKRQTTAFDNWEVYRKFLKDLGTTGTLGISMAQAELIFIATTPDAHASEYRSAPKYYTPWYYSSYLSAYQYDKSRITHLNTDFCLGAMGVFHIEVLGESSGAAHNICSHLQVCSRLCDVYQQTSQANLKKRAAPGRFHSQKTALSPDLKDRMW